jgi:GTP-binding protein
MRLAVVGRRNVGKSTFINQLAQSERVIVSNIPGTTRDSIDIRFEVDGKSFIAIDTPGVRKKKSLANDIEFYGLVRAQRSIRRADLVLMFFDATQTISKVDKQLVEEINEHYKPCIFVINKWDAALDEEMTTEKWVKYLLDTFSSMRHVPIAIITAKDGRNIRKLVNLAQSVYKQANLRMSTSRLNKAVQRAIEKNPPPIRKNRRPKIYFASQIAGSPPTIVLKCNESSLLDESWKRYLLGYLREVTPFQEVPIRLVLRGRNESDPDLLSGDTPLPPEMTSDAEVIDEIDDEPEISELTDDQLRGDDDPEFDESWDDSDVYADDILSLEDDDPDKPAPNFVDDDEL